MNVAGRASPYLRVTIFPTQCILLFQQGTTIFVFATNLASLLLILEACDVAGSSWYEVLVAFNEVFLFDGQV